MRLQRMSMRQDRVLERVRLHAAKIGRDVSAWHRGGYPNGDSPSAATDRRARLIQCTLEESDNRETGDLTTSSSQEEQEEDHESSRGSSPGVRHHESSRPAGWARLGPDEETSEASPICLIRGALARCADLEAENGHLVTKSRHQGALLRSLCREVQRNALTNIQEPPKTNHITTTHANRKPSYEATHQQQAKRTVNTNQQTNRAHTTYPRSKSSDGWWKITRRQIPLPRQSGAQHARKCR